MLIVLTGTRSNGEEFVKFIMVKRAMLDAFMAAVWAGTLDLNHMAPFGNLIDPSDQRDVMEWLDSSTPQTEEVDQGSREFKVELPRPQDWLPLLSQKGQPAVTSVQPKKRFT